MPAYHAFICTEAQRDAILPLNTTVLIIPNAVTTENPGVGFNNNDHPTCTVDLGEPIALTGKWLAPYAAVNNPDYLAEAPNLVTYLLTLPAAIVDTDSVFVPVDV